MKTEFASAGYTAGQLNAIVKLLRKQAGEDGVERFLRGEITVSKPTRSWREQDGVIYFPVTSDGTTGEEWIKRLEDNGFCVGEYAKSILRSPDFKPTSGVTTEVAVLKGILFEDNDRISKNIRANATERKFINPNAEVACLIREKFTDKEIEEMGLRWIVAMYEPINDSGGALGLLRAYRSNNGLWLYADYGKSGRKWHRVFGFAFSVSQVDSLT